MMIRTSRSPRLCWTIALLAILLPAARSQALTPDLEVIAVSGQSALEPIDGYEARSVGARLLGADGQVAFSVLMKGSGIDNWLHSLWRSDQQHTEMVALAGEPAPGTNDGSVYGLLDPQRFVSDGTLYFLSDLSPIGRERSKGLLAHAAGGSATLQARFTETYRDHMSINQNGLTVVFANDRNIYLYEHLSSSPRLAFERGSNAPGFDVDQPLALGVPSLNNQGLFVAGGGLRSSDKNNTGYWTVNQAGDVTQVVREGSPAPHSLPMAEFGDMNLFFRAFPSRAVINDAGQVAFHTGVRLSTTPVDEYEDFAIWATDSAGVLHPIAERSALAPGGGGLVFDYLFEPLISNHGDVVFAGDLRTSSPEQIFSNSGIWKGRVDEDLVPVALEGQQAPGLPTGAVFGDFGFAAEVALEGGSFEVNGSGRVAFTARLRISPDADLELGNSPHGIWAEDLNGELQLIAHTGGTIDVDPDPAAVDERVIQSIWSLGAINGNVSQQYFNDRGQILFTATFTDGTTGVFVSNLVAVPEPAGLALIAAAAGLLRRPRRHAAPI
ncbi:hypothetical protein Pla123a_17340 [Posidoniimonas polymericola]|uniref:PEP-CTERM protein-sorting domain-containing protein n=1 Tax=Posidoniimonas polymericola TaxID=2528002 RepID=A0A5C5YSL1_9BACT|nr:choice-of-anchor tandem repeat NxxGxxAF-containing protein [Posidoniimonas polymericola]TWT77935.1 hypothetical protein Pla123a_17340 [Posidoniimonas polymericola]